MEIISTTIEDTSTIEVFWQDEVKIDVDLSVLYIKSGQKEIADYVENVSKQEISAYTQEYSRPIVTQVVEELAEPLVENYVETISKPEIDKHIAHKISEFNTDVEEKQQTINTCVSETTNQASLATIKATEAATSATQASQHAIQASEYNFRNIITNCITAIPQDIIFTLENGVLTLKSGSKIYIPSGKKADGSNNFKKVIIKQDMTIPAYTYSGPASTMFFAKEDSTQVATTIAIASGETSPGEGYNFWYDTSANIIKYSSSVNDNWDSGGWSLPLGLGLRSSGIYTSLEQIFNGFGYIGSTIFSLPDVKGLIANGKNSDGSLHNIAFTTSEINMYTFDKNANYNNRIYWLTSSGSLGGLNPNIQYNSQFNKVLYNVDYSQRLYCDIGCFTVINGVVQTFLSKTPFKAVDNWETSLIDDYIIETGISGNQWYELYKSNRLKQGGYSQSGNITFIKPYADTNYTLINGNSKSTTGFTINTGFGDWYSDGKGAQ